MYLRIDDARKFYEMGRRAKAKGILLADALYRFVPEEWNRQTAFDLGYQGKPFVVGEYRRYGQVRLHPYTDLPMPSHNYMDDRQEWGVSVVTEEWRQTVHGIFFVANASDKGRTMITLHGIDTGHKGGDGEPLVLPVQI